MNFEGFTLLAYGFAQNTTPNMMTWDAPGKKGKAVKSTLPTANGINDEKPRQAGEPNGNAKTSTNMEKDTSTGEEKSGSEKPGPVTEQSSLDVGDSTSKAEAVRGSRVLSDKEPTFVSLSGGQMQRVAISRSFMRADQATLVVLEYVCASPSFSFTIGLNMDSSEPSASLDARAEHELFQTIHALSKGASEDTRTTVYISHRFSTVRRADKIVVVEDGTITELGSHKQLMELNGRYAEFFNLQVKAFSED